MGTYRDLIAWQKAMDLAVLAYSVTRNFPNDERFGLASQIRRSAASIPANIAEGHGRDSAGAFANFLRIAQGSLRELETHVILATRVEIIERRPHDELLAATNEVGKILRALINAQSGRLPTKN